jgi:hypothetical protein
MSTRFWCSILAAALIAAVSTARADIAVAPPEGSADPAILGALRVSLESAAKEAPASPGLGGTLGAAASPAAAGAAIEVTFVPDDGGAGIREARVVRAEDVGAAALEMARSVLRELAARAPVPQPVTATPVPQPVSATPVPQPVAATPPPQVLRQYGPADFAAPKATVRQRSRVSDGVRFAARPGIIAGMALDVAGFLGAFISLFAAVGGEDFDTPFFAAECAFGGTFVLGSAVSSSSHSIRHARYSDAGLAPPIQFPVAAWMLTVASGTLYASSIVNWERHVTGDSIDDIGPVFVTVFTFILSAVSEAIDFGLVRTLWRRRLERLGTRAAEPPELVPIVVSRDEGRASRLALGLGLAGSF